MAKDTILNTKNILATLKEYATTHNYDLKSLDFSLLGLQTYIKTCHMETFVKFHEDYKKKYSQASALINDHVRFIQIYKIKLHKKKKSNFELIYRLELGEFSTHPILLIATDSTFPLNEVTASEMLKLLYTECNKIKAQNKMLVNQFSSCLIKDLKAFVSKIYKNGFTNEESILLFEGIDPLISEPSKVINHYKKKGQKVSEVEASDLIITYVKPVYGDAGLNAMGQIISHGTTNNLAKIEYQIDTKNINVQDSKMQIKYYSKSKGFVSTLKNTLSISNKIIVEDIKRVEAKLTKKEENQVSIVISQSDVTRDGIGEGVELVSESVHITGHMGAKASIEAKEVVIDGATHHTSFVTSKSAKINRHKGTLRCHKAEINSLEGGTVYATYVTINAALGGQVCAEHVTIKTIKHNLKVFASKSITIERILGEDNHFVIDYRKLPVIQSKLQYLNQELEDARWKYEDAKKHSQDKLPELKKIVDTKEASIKEIKLSHYDAVITIMAPVDGLNTIEFAIPEKQTSLIYRTKEPKSFEPFSVKQKDDKITLEPVGISIER
ncbi:MAG: hypothetical protein COA44_12000 [Arcobacter sp.]|nr:MAG: hypothetical protein COA44_12000 [Arcobacter sp.]